MSAVRFAYADPPYIGCAHMYKDHPDYGGEVDHEELVSKLLSEYDGFCLHTHVPGLRVLLPMMPDDVRVCAWVKPFAAFKPNVAPAYAWEPVLIRPVVKAEMVEGVVCRDWVSESITMKRGLTGVKPEKVCHWVFNISGLMGAEDETVIDLFPGTGAVGRAWDTYRDRLEWSNRQQLTLKVR